MTYAIFNNKLIKTEEIYISPQDRGFRYGDGVFDTLLVRNGKIYQLAWHLRRLEDGLKAIKINFMIYELESLCQQLLDANKVTDGLLRIQITRGVGGRGYLPEEGRNVTLLIEAIDKPKSPSTPATLWQSSYQKISRQALPVQFKLCQGLNSTLARMEATEYKCFDSLLLNEKNEICETSSANIFWFKNGELYTPALDCGVLEGSIRTAVIRLSPFKVHKVAANIDELKKAESVFITNVAWKILAVSELKPIDIKWQSEDLSSQILALLENDIKKAIS